MYTGRNYIQKLVSGFKNELPVLVAEEADSDLLRVSGVFSPASLMLWEYPYLL